MKVEGRIKAEGGMSPITNLTTPPFGHPSFSRRGVDFGFKKGEFRRDSSFFSDYHESILEK
ncbi:MAG: hypothetical protein PHR19_06840 [Bacteroidales bacterium]|nr:hypothetical protein [Bacteroidales bacterium]